ncbi:eukaryotic translation initiation factor 4E type 3-A isoform X2 [Osmia lignaria lignaria]|uniref:eukaryotic translation initiation factor 4E type 3-A isoform X2 n=1 Tax=Osmia lignaria lignaria TaxID=1437193 RepID=UPI0014783B44|nr:eukaryotic translation initiation factor 4E type 3-A-like isoform X2 [Osmia lignaria]
MASMESALKDEASSGDITQVPVFSDERIKRIEEQETSGDPLQSSWTFWLGRAISASTVEEYKTNLLKIYTVNTVQGFWAVFNNIPSVKYIQVRWNYHLMRDERYPLWEEPVNQHGGTWRLKCHKSDTEKIWKEVVLAAIGEQFDECVAEGDEIWNTNAALASKATVLEKVQSLLPNVNCTKFYKPHQSHHAYGRS